MNAIALLPSADGTLAMSTLEIERVTGSRHDNVKVTVDRLVARGTIAQPAMQDEQTADALGRPRMVSVYLLKKRDSLIVVAQLCPEFTARLVDRWQELENQAVAGGLPNFANPATAARAWAEQYEQKQLAQAERDEAIRTKAQIGSKREATAMAKASSATRKVKQLTHELGRNMRHATIIAVEKASGRKFGSQDWRPLKKYCAVHDLHPEKVHDPRWGEATAWPAAAWRDVYGISLEDLFQDAALEAV